MRYLPFLILVCASCSPVPVVAIELVDDQVTLSTKERHTLSQCQQQGGCFIVTQAEVTAAMQRLQQETIEIAAEVAVQHIQEAVETCRKGKI